MSSKLRQILWRQKHQLTEAPIGKFTLVRGLVSATLDLQIINVNEAFKMLWTIIQWSISIQHAPQWLSCWLALLRPSLWEISYCLRRKLGTVLFAKRMKWNRLELWLTCVWVGSLLSTSIFLILFFRFLDRTSGDWRSLPDERFERRPPPPTSILASAWGSVAAVMISSRSLSTSYSNFGDTCKSRSNISL